MASLRVLALPCALLVACADPGGTDDDADASSEDGDETVGPTSADGDDDDDDDASDASDGGEADSDGDGESGDAAACGNGIVDPGEDCDSGESNDGPDCSHLCRAPGERLWTAPLRDRGGVFEWETADPVGVQVGPDGPVAVLHQPGLRTAIVTTGSDGNAGPVVELSDATIDIQSMAVGTDGHVAIGGLVGGSAFVAHFDPTGEPLLFDDAAGSGSVRQVIVDGDTTIAAINDDGLVFVGYRDGSELWRRPVDGLVPAAGLEHPVRHAGAWLWGAEEPNANAVSPVALEVTADGSPPVSVFDGSTQSSFVGIAPTRAGFALPTLVAPDGSTTTPMLKLVSGGQEELLELPAFGGAHVFPTSMVVDARGNLVIGLASQLSDGLGAVVKLSPRGELLWARSLLDGAEDPNLVHDVVDVAVDDDGFVYALTEWGHLICLTP